MENIPGKVFEPFKKKEEASFLTKLKAGALALGMEEYTVEKAKKYYNPEELSSDPKIAEERLREMEMDYYMSGAKTLEEWAEDREEYDSLKDSTGRDDE